MLTYIKGPILLVTCVGLAMLFEGSPKANVVIAEEIQNASTVVPWVMISSIMLNGTMGLALLVCYNGPLLSDRL